MTHARIVGTGIRNLGCPIEEDLGLRQATAGHDPTPPHRQHRRRHVAFTEAGHEGQRMVNTLGVEPCEVGAREIGAREEFFGQRQRSIDPLADEEGHQERTLGREFLPFQDKPTRKRLFAGGDRVGGAPSQGIRHADGKAISQLDNRARARTRQKHPSLIDYGIEFAFLEPEPGSLHGDLAQCF